MTPARVYLATMICPTGRRWVRVGWALGLGRPLTAMLRHLPYPVRKVLVTELNSKPLAKRMVKDLAATMPRSTSVNGWFEIEDEHDLAGIAEVAERYTGSDWPWEEKEVKRG